MKFHKIYLEISDICHLQCCFCPCKKATKGVMPLELFDSITSQIQKKTRFVSLHILGDPLCIENLQAYLEIMAHKQIQLDIVSSGIFLQEKHFALLSTRNIHQISFSLDAFYDRNNQKIIQQTFNHSQNIYFERIFALYDFLQHLPHTIFLNLRLFGQYNYDFLLQRFPNFIPQESKNRIRLAKHFFLRFHKEFQWHTLQKKYQNSLHKHFVALSHAKTIAKPYCLGSITQLGILANGIVVPCCLDAMGYMQLGNLTEQTFQEILDSDIFRSFQHAQLRAQNLPQICQNCSFRGI